jgi:hypothetical protein
VSNQPPSDARAPEGLSPAARLFWSRFVRGLSFLAVAFAVVALIELALTSAGPVLLDRCGHALRAIQVGPGHLPLAATAAVALCAVVASAGAPGSRGRAAFIACACGALLASFEVSMRVANARKCVLALRAPSESDRSVERLLEVALAAGCRPAMRVDLGGCYLPDGHPDRRGHERIAAAAREAAK